MNTLITPYTYNPALNNGYIPEHFYKDSPYKYEGKYVPRVTEILSDMLHVDSLMNWSNYIGLYKHQSYKDVLDKAATIGTMVHNAIEEYLQQGTMPIFNHHVFSINESATNAFNSFLEWWKVISTHNVSIVMEEAPLICFYYGGTVDLVLNIDGKNYLIDFKTSNHPSSKYFLQLAAYKRILNEQYHLDISGCIILMLSKSEVRYNEIMLNLDDVKDFMFMKDCETTFMSLVYAYYNRYSIENKAKGYLKEN